MKNRVIIILLIIFILLFIVSASVLISSVLADKMEKDAFVGLAEMVEQEKQKEDPVDDFQPTEILQINPDNTDVTSSTETTDEELFGILPEYQKVYQLNKDLFAWIRIDDTSINYPVMFTPNDPEYYLRRAFDKNNSESGTPFVDGACYEGGGIYLVYGHNMKNGTMFAELTKYAEEKYRNEHAIIHFDTIYERRQYEVIAAFYSKVYSADEQGFRYYQYTDLAAPTDFYEYTDQIKAVSIYDTGYVADFGDELLTLSTCDYYMNDGRFVVVAKRIK